MDEFIKLTEDFARMLKILSKMFSFVLSCYILLAHGFSFTLPGKLENIISIISKGNIVFALLSIILYTIFLIGLGLLPIPLKMFAEVLPIKGAFAGAKRLVLLFFNKQYNVEVESFIKKINYEAVRLRVRSIIENWMFLNILLIIFDTSCITILLFGISLLIGLIAIRAADLLREWIIELRVVKEPDTPIAIT